MLQWVEDMITGLGMVAKKPLSSLCDVRAADEELIYTHDGSIGSFIRINGAFKILSQEEQERRRQVLETRLAPFFGSPGHILDCCYRMDPTLAGGLSRALHDVWLGGARALGVDFEDIIKSKENLLKTVGNPEENVWVLWTTPVALTKEERKYQLKAFEKTLSGLSIASGQSLEGLLTHQKDKHKPAVIALVSSLKAAGVDAEVLPAKQGLSYSFSSTNPKYAASGFKPVTLADETEFADVERVKDGDYSGFFPPPINEQMFVGGGKKLEANVFQMNDTIWGYFTMKVGPKPERPFAQLVSELNTAKVPWRLRLQVAGGEPPGLQLRKSLAFATKATNPTTERLYKAAEEVDADRSNGVARVSFSIAFATWAPFNRKSELFDQLAKLHAAVTQWGGIYAAADAGDILEGVMSSALGISPRTVAVKGAPRLRNCLKMLPLFRPSCPFKRPSMIFRTPNGSLWNYEVGSPELTRFLNLYIGEPGLGKSALLNSVNNASILAKASDGMSGAIPYMGILDIGPSSKGLVQEYKDALPEHRQHLAQYLKLQNDRSHAVNVFDTPVGLRSPLPNHNAFLIQFLAALFVAPEDNDGANIGRVLSVLIEEVYSLKSDKREPKEYSPQIVPAVDDILSRLNIDGSKLTWWNVTDLLFENGYEREAMIAQRYAVPVMSDLARVLSQDRLREFLKGAKLSNGMEMSEQLKLMLSAEAAKYPILYNTTSFDLAGARLVSLDLQDVVPRTKDTESNRAAELMYMLGRHLVASELYISESDFDLAVEPYRTFHKARIRQDKSQMRFVSYDEFHRTNGRPYVRNIISADGREARKYNVHINLASQLISDFDDETLSMASAIFILGAQDEKIRETIANRLSLTEAAREVMNTTLHGPSSEGAPFLGVFKTRNGEYQQLLYHNMSAEELWMLTTTDEDVRLKEQLSKEIGGKAARVLLAQRFPNGSAKEEIKSMEYTANKSGRGKFNNAIEIIAKQIVRDR